MGTGDDGEEVKEGSAAVEEVVEEFSGGKARIADIKTKLYLLMIPVDDCWVGEEVPDSDDHEDGHDDGVHAVATTEQNQGPIAVVNARGQA